MKNTFKRLSIIGLILVFVFGLTISAQGATAKINKTKATMYAGQTITLSVSNAKKVSWSTNKKKIATVTVKNQKATVKAVKPGKVTITAKVGKKSYKCKVTVKKPELDKKKLTLEKGKKYKLKLLGMSIKSVKSSNKKIATVNKKGVVTAKELGKATITVTGKNGKKYTCKVTVVNPEVKVSKITVSAAATTMKVGDRQTVKATVAPENATNKALTWSSSNTSVATVSNSGEVTAIAPGNAAITAKAADGSNVSDTVNLTVISPVVTVKSITLSETKATLSLNGTIALSAIVAPDNANNKDIVWKSSDEKVATVSANGLVTAVAGGTANIVATAKDGSGISATCVVTVDGESIIVSTVAELLDATTDENIKKIILKSNTTDCLVIPEGSYDDIELVVDLPNGEIEDNAHWKEVRIEAIAENTFIEKAKGNFLRFVAPSGTIHIDKNAQAQIMIDEPVQKNNNVQRTLKVVDDSDSELVSDIDMVSNIDLTITGDNANTIGVTAQDTAEGSMIKSSKRLNFHAKAKTQLVLEAGSEDSTISVDDEKNIPDVEGLGRIPVTNIATGVETFVVAENNGQSNVNDITVKGEISVDGARVYLVPYDNSLNEDNAEARFANVNPSAVSQEGKFTISNCSLGNYTLVVLANGYAPVVNTIIITSSTSAGAVYQIEYITLISVTDIQINGNVSGTIIDSVTGNPIEYEVVLNLRAGINNISGDIIKSVKSQNGTYSFENLPSGNYTIHAQTADAEHSITSNIVNITVLANQTVTVQITVTRSLQVGQVQFVLHWNKEGVNDHVPSDLDSHLVGPAPDGSRFHTWYSNKNYYYNDARYDDLDVDDTTYEGPETTTIYNKVNGVYSFYVHDYSNRYNENCNYMSDFSAAHVEIKSNTSVVDDIHIPTGQTGNLWHVADYDSRTGRFTRVNTVSWIHVNDGEDVGLTEEEILARGLSNGISNLSSGINTLYDNAFKTSAKNLLKRAENMRDSNNLDKDAVTAIVAEMSECVNKINDAFYINITGESINNYDYYNSDQTIYLYGTEPTVSDYTIYASNENGEEVTVAKSAASGEENLVGKVLITNTVSGVARQYNVYYRYDESTIFKIKGISAPNCLRTYYDMYGDSGEIELYGLADSFDEIKDDVTVECSYEGVTSKIETVEDDGDKYYRCTLTYQDTTYTYYIYYYCIADQVYDLKLNEEFTLPKREDDDWSSAYYRFTPTESALYTISADSYDIDYYLYNDKGIRVYEYYADDDNNSVSFYLEKDKAYTIRLFASINTKFIVEKTNINYAEDNRYNIYVYGDYLEASITKNDDFGVINILAFDLSEVYFEDYYDDTCSMSTENLPDDGCVGLVSVYGRYNDIYTYRVYQKSFDELATTTITEETEQEAQIVNAGDCAVYKFVPETDGQYTFSSDTDSYDTYGQLYSDEGEKLAYDDDGGTGNNFSITYDFTAGKTYYLVAKLLSSSSTGNFPVTLVKVED